MKYLLKLLAFSIITTTLLWGEETTSPSEDSTKTQSESWFSRIFSKSEKKRSGISMSQRGKRPTQVPKKEKLSSIVLPPPQPIIQETLGKEAAQLPDKNFRLGDIVWYDSSLNYVVGELDSRFLQINDLILARDASLTVTAVLKPAKFKRNKIQGFDVVQGNPNPGDTIFIPNSILSAQYLNPENLETAEDS